jgi:membrane protein insertase Oxa1/YidC/SpoIIIJ
MSAEQLEKMQQEQMALQQEIMELEKAEPVKNVRRNWPI